MVLNLVVIGVAVALDPLPLMAFLVILPSKRGVGKGAAFVFGWLASLVVVVAVTVLATGNNPPKPDTAPSLGGGGEDRHRGRPGRDCDPAAPQERTAEETEESTKWQAHVDSMSPWYAMGLAPVLQPWGLIGAGAATVMEDQAGQCAELSRAVPVLRPGLGVLPFNGDLRRPQAG